MKRTYGMSVALGTVWPWAVVGLLAAATAQAAPPQRLVVPLSQPGKAVSLSVSLIQGGVEIEAYDGKDVVVEARPAEAGEDSMGEAIGEALREALPVVAGAARPRPRPDPHPSVGDRHGESASDKSAGMKRIPNHSFGLRVEEDNNEVEVSADSWRVAMDLRILVPANTRLEVSCVNSGDIKVEGVTGDMELSNVNGSITVHGAVGAVVADTVNGELKVTFARLASDKAMAFNSLNGDVDLSFPADLRAAVTLRTDNGEIFSDFDVDLDSSGPRVKQEKGDKGGYRVVVESGVRGTIAGGGREIQATTFNGDIYLRRAKP